MSPVDPAALWYEQIIAVVAAAAAGGGGGGGGGRREGEVALLTGYTFALR